MNPCKITPERLSFLIDKKELLESCELKVTCGICNDNLTLNRMLSIAEGEIADYFYGMADQFDELNSLFASPWHNIATKSFGEVAYDIGRLCEDPLLQPQNPSENQGRDAALSDDSDGAEAPDESAAPLEFSEKAQDAILAFMKPLSHLSSTLLEKGAPIPSSKWKRPSREKSSPRCEETVPLSLKEKPLNYFEDHFVARKYQAPETRLFHAFSFTCCMYYESVRIVYGEKTTVNKTLEQFPDSWTNLLQLIHDLTRICESRTEPIFFALEDEIISGAPNYERIALAFNALYALFIRPFALIHIEHEPLRRYIEEVSSAQ